MKEYNRQESITPGPGSYKVPYIPFNNQEHSFGGPIKIIPSVKILCSTSDRSKCCKCRTTPVVGDYWKNFKTNRNYCRGCMKSEKREIQQMYRLVRYCGFYHDHQNTTARPTLLTKEFVLRKIRAENYLSKFYL